MTAIFYPDFDALSPDLKLRLEARSPHNGTICHRDGSAPSESEYAFKYKDHQSEFRYQLIETLNGNVLWTRWQAQGEDSPHQLLLSNEGWSILRTHGFAPEIIAVSPGGVDVLRVKISGEHSEKRTADPNPQTPTFNFQTGTLSFTTAGNFWSGNSWHYFFRYRGEHYFVWRTYMGERIVLNLDRAQLLNPGAQDAAFIRVMNDEETRGATEVLHELSNRVRDIVALLAAKNEKRSPDSLRKNIGQASAALNLVCAHSILDCSAYARVLEQIDCPLWSTSSHGLPGWSVEAQYFRPVAQHALKFLDLEPGGFATYHFFHELDKTRFLLPECISNRRELSRTLNKSMSGEQVLRLLGSPDFVSRRSRQEGRIYRWSETWEYDFRSSANYWTTLKVTLEEEKRTSRIIDISESEAAWLTEHSRLYEILEH